MSHDESEAEFERRYPQSKRGMPLWAILLIVLGSVGAAGCIGAVVLGAIGMVFRPVTPPAAPPAAMVNTSGPPTRQVTFTRAEFERAVMGKTTDEVQEVLGLPPVSSGWDGEETWAFNSRTTDPATDREDEVSEVVFRGGKAVRVNYRGEIRPGGPAPPEGQKP